MKIIDKTVQAGPRTTTLNEIPVGQVFRGSVYSSRSNAFTTGTFLKAYGPWKYCGDDDRSKGQPNNVVVVRIDKFEGNPPGFCNLWTQCGLVTDYEPLDVELVIKGVLA